MSETPGNYFVSPNPPPLILILKPCPFCGGEVRYEEFNKGYIYCEKCDYDVSNPDSRLLVRMWNARPVEDELKAKIERTKFVIYELIDELGAE